MNQKKILLDGPGRDLLLTVLTLGLWNLFVNIRQVNTVNTLINSKDQNSSDKFPPFSMVFLLSILTLGIYFCFHEYKMSKLLYRLNFNQSGHVAGILSFLATFFGLWFFVDTYQQMLINNLIVLQNETDSKFEYKFFL